MRHKWVRFTLFVLLTCASLLLAWMLLESDPARRDLLAAVVSMFAGVGALGVAVFQVLPGPPPPPSAEEAADQLAVTVREQWAEEARARQLRDPRVIPLSWATTERPVSAPAESIVGLAGGRVLRMSLNGRLEGDFAHAAARLAAGYRQVDSGRLVILGEPGAGKTVLALMLTLGLLEDRAPRSPVPVLLSVSTWDPVSESLDDWIISNLADAYYGGRGDIPRMLLNQRTLLPVLDGLDEMPEPSRRSAVRALNEACGDGRGVVVTCRSAEYEDVIAGGSPALRRAPVIEVAPVPVSDAVAFLEDVNWPEGINWEPVYAHLRQHPHGPAATALSTPLSLTLARTVYRHCDRDPAELLDYDSQHKVEDHLIDHLIPAAYAPPPGHLPGGTAREWRYDAEQAERWLTFLATYLHQHRERDLAWWRMSHRLLPRWAGLPIGVAAGLLTMFAVAAAAVAVDAEITLSHFTLGLVVGVLAMLTWYAAPERLPGRASFALRGSLHQLRVSFRTGFTRTSFVAAVALGIDATITTFSGDWAVETVNFFWMAAVALGVAIAIGMGFAFHAWLDAPPESSTRANPADLLRRDRASFLVGVGLAGPLFGITTFLISVAIPSISYFLFLALRRAPGGFPSVADVVTNTVSETENPVMALARTVAPGFVFAVLMFLTRAWPRFTLLRLFLAAKRQAPFRFMSFLADARGRQLLRQSAGTYQFRHIRLQEHLANRFLAQNHTPPPRAQVIRRRRNQLVAIGTALAVGSILVTQVTPEDSSYQVIFTGRVERMGFSPSENQALITIDEDGFMRRWNTRTGKREVESKVLPSRDSSEWDRSEWGFVASESGAVTFNYATNEAWTLPWEGKQVVRGESPIPKHQFEKGQWAKVSTRGAHVLTDRKFDQVMPGKRETFSGNIEGTVVAMNDRGAFLFTSEEHPTHMVDSAGRKKTCAFADEIHTAVIDESGTLIAAAENDSTSVHIRGGECEKKGESISVYKPIGWLALDEGGTNLAINTGNVTRLYDLRERRQ